METKDAVETNTIFRKDCISGLKELPENSVDLIIADPPYNLSKGNDWEWENEVDLEGFGGEWKKTMENWDDMGLEEYFYFSLAWLKESKRVLKKSGSIWTFGTYHNSGIVNFVYQLIGIEIINEIIWFKRNAFPNLSGRRFTASHENILWGHSGDSNNRNYKYNYDFIKEAEFPEDNINEAGKQVRTVWDIPNNKSKEETENGSHPTQKPLRVLERIVLASTEEGDVCLVPFCGSGAACLSAKLNERDYIGFEPEEEYADLAEKNLENLKDKPESVRDTCTLPEPELWEE